MVSDDAAAGCPLVAIVGPTASGKTALAVELARKFNGEIISADSRAVYQGMDVGAAKPTMEERANVPHWGFDLVAPGSRFTAADFKQYAVQKIADIRARGRIPFLVGGTGLYVDSVLFDYSFGDDQNTHRRQQLEEWSLAALQNYCIKNNVKLPENRQNKRYIIRAIEQNGVSTSRDKQVLRESIVVGIATKSAILRARIVHRAEHILTNNVVEEATILGAKYGWDNEAMTGNVYPLVRSYLLGDMTDKDIVEKLTTSDWRLAKRQLTWFRRNPFIYGGGIDEIHDFVQARLGDRV